MRSLPRNETALREAILPHVQDLSPALQLAADYVLKNPNIAAMRSLRQMAEISRINPPTFTRLAQSLGFDSYEELRELCRQAIQGTSTFSDKALALQKRTSSGPGTFISSHAAASINNIESLAKSIEPAALAKAADELAKARHVVLVGSLSSASLIDHLGYMAQMAFTNWRTLLRNHETVTVALKDLGPKDVMLVLSFKPYATSAVDAAHRAHAAGISVIAISDSYSAPVMAHAARAFVIPTDSPHFFASAVPLTVFFESLLSMVVRRSGKGTRDRITAIERENHKSGEYWQG